MIKFFVPGKVQPGGSKRGFKRGKHVVVVDANPNAAGWKQDVKLFASKNYEGAPLECPLMVTCTFVMQRPKKHYFGGKRSHILRPDAPFYHTHKPDTTKLFRSTEDALTGVIWKDDGQVAIQTLKKVYGDAPGAHIQIEEC